MSIKHTLSQHPKELWILSLAELCERFAFYGIGLLLVLYTIEYYHFSNEKATQIYGIFTGFAAFSPLYGGWIADRWNYQTPMVLGAVLNVIGCFMVATGIQSLFYVALFIIACGYGIFTPSVLTVLGFVYRNHPNLREAGFSIYYASINIGVFLALVSLSSVAAVTSWNWAFSIAGVVQLIGLIPLFWYLTRHKDTYHALKSAHKKARTSKQKLTPIEKDRIKVIIAFCLISILFWTAYNQGFSSMAIFANQFMNRTVGDWKIPEGVFLSSGTFFLVVLAPILSYLYAWLQKRKQDPSTSKKTALSLFFTAVCFLVMIFASLGIPEGATSASVPYGYLIFAFFFMAVGEMLLAPIGLSMITHLAPRRYNALAVGFWYVCVGFAFFVGGMLASFMKQMGSLADFFSVFVIMTLVPAIVLLLASNKLTRMSHLDKAQIDSNTK